MSNRFRRRIIILALIALCAIAVVIKYNLRPTTSAMPIQSVSAITAALDRQVAARRESLEVVYSLTVREADPATGGLSSRPPVKLATIRYIRTPTALYTREENQIVGMHTTTNTFFKDASANRWMMVSKRRPPGGAFDVRAAVGSRAMGISSTLDLLDPLEVRLGMKPVREWLTQGSLAPDAEEIGGHECYRVDALDAPNGGTNSIWIDPTIGCMPRRVAVIMPKGVTDFTIDYLAYKEVAKGVWYPMRAEITSWRGKNGKINSINYMTASKVSVGKKFTRSQLEPTIPSGTPIYWRDKRVYTTQP